MKKRTAFIRYLTIISLVVVLLLTATSASAAGKTVKVGLILLPEDSWYNDMSEQGFNSAVKAYSLTGTIYRPANYEEMETVLRQCAMDGNTLCIGLGFMVADPLFKVAGEFPDTKFMLNDYSPIQGLVIPSNTRLVYYDTRQVGYLAGVLAAYMTQTNILGVVGGMDIPPVNEFIDGFRNAARCTNLQLEVQVLYAGDFANPDLGAYLAEQLMSGGADIIYPVAGGTGDGALYYSTQNGAWAIGVDNDQYYTTFAGGTIAGADKLLTSTVKRMDLGIYYTIGDLVKGHFTSGYKLYGLAQNGVELAPYHDTSSAIPTAVKKAVDKVKTDIIKGKINIYAPCR